MTTSSGIAPISKHKAQKATPCQNQSLVSTHQIRSNARNPVRPSPHSRYLSLMGCGFIERSLWHECLLNGTCISACRRATGRAIDDSDESFSGFWRQTQPAAQEWPSRRKLAVIEFQIQPKQQQKCTYSNSKNHLSGVGWSLLFGLQAHNGKLVG